MSNNTTVNNTHYVVVSFLAVDKHLWVKTSWSSINSCVVPHQFAICVSSLQLCMSLYNITTHTVPVCTTCTSRHNVQRAVREGNNSEGRKRPTCSCQFSRLHACLKEPWQEGRRDINTHLHLLWLAPFTTRPLTVCPSVLRWGLGLLQCWHITAALLSRLEKWPPLLCWSYHEQTASSKHPRGAKGQGSGVTPHTIYIGIWATESQGGDNCWAYNVTSHLGHTQTEDAQV